MSIYALALMDILDGVSTAIGLHYGVLVELNPLMLWFWTVNPLLFLAFKALTAVVIIALMRGLKSDRIVQWVAAFGVGVYLGVLVDHFLGWLAFFG